jgi:hypothetical protein
VQGARAGAGVTQTRRTPFRSGQGATGAALVSSGLLFSSLALLTLVVRSCNAMVTPDSWTAGTVQPTSPTCQACACRDALAAEADAPVAYELSPTRHGHWLATKVRGESAVKLAEE